MATLAFNHEEIAARELKPELYELDGISRASVEAHYKLYQGYVEQAERDPREARRASTSPPRTRSTPRSARLKVDLTFAIGGVKNHEIYFEHLGGGGGDPDGLVGELIERDFGSVEAGAHDLKGDRHGRTRLGLDGLRLGRAAPLQLHRRRAEHVPDLERDARSSRSTSTSTRTSSTTRPTAASYIDAFFENLDWDVVNDWVVEVPDHGVAAPLTWTSRLLVASAT